jgi:glycosyltransferase involved in cell wall biosynthesis
MKILMLVDQIGAEAGGAERMASALAGEIAERGEPITLCVTRGVSAAEAEPLERQGVRVLGLERGSRFDLGAFGPLRRLLREQDFDVLHAHKFGSNVWGVLFGRLARVPLVIAHEHTWSYEGEPLRKLADWLIGRFATRFLAVSSLDRKRMIERERVPADKIVVIPNPHIPRPEAPAGDLRAELGLEPGTPLVGTVAVLRAQKALEVLIEAFAQLGEPHSDARLVIAGDGGCRTQLEVAAREQGVEQRAHFLGTRQDVPALLAAFDVAAMSSDFEGSPLFALECLASGTPLVATRVGGLPDIVEDGVSGLLVPPRDPAAMAQAIGSLLSDPGLADRIGEGAVVRAGEFSLRRTTDRVLALYGELLDQAGEAHG